MSGEKFYGGYAVQLTGTTAYVSITEGGVSNGPGYYFNGSSWTAVTSNQPNGFTLMASDRNVTVVGAATSYGYVTTSKDGGHTFTLYALPSPLTVNVNGIFYLSGVSKFYACCGGGLASSPDGITWTLEFSTGNSNINVNSITEGSSLYIAVGYGFGNAYVWSKSYP